MADGLPENVPHSGKYAVELNFDNAGGNHVVVEIAPHRYVLYALRLHFDNTIYINELV
jgi:hypothetical protein